jgi:hypothetical protein
MRQDVRGRSCRTARRSDSRLRTSLSRVTPSAVSEHSSELIGCPISTSLATCCVVLNQGPFPPPALPGFSGTTGLSATPSARPVLTGVRLVIPDHAIGASRVACAFLVYMLSPLPRHSDWRYLLAHPSSRVSLPRRVLGSACASSFSRLTQRSLTLRPAHSRCHQFVARLPEGFSHFVTSMTAPVASGWSGCRVGLAPTGKRRLITAHAHCGQYMPILA